MHSSSSLRKENCEVYNGLKICLKSHSKTVKFAMAARDTVAEVLDQGIL